MRLLSTTLRLTAGTFTVLAVTACLSLVVATRALHLTPVAVYSGSMEPRIPTGGLVLERLVPSSSVRVGDVISFADPYDTTKVVTHRVVQIVQTREGPGYRTRGDANPSRDAWTLKLPATVGRAETTVPVAGYVLVYLQTREVRTGLIALAALTILLSLLRRIWFPPSRKCAPAA
jgi:signal peptidase